MNRASGTSYRGSTFSERMAAAPCLQTDPELSFPSGKGTFETAYTAAKRDCARCPLELREECLEIAMKAEGTAALVSRFGVFGGLDPEERVALAEEGIYRPKVLAAEHGTEARAKAHRRAGEKPCGSCLAGESRAWLKRSQGRKAT